MVNKSLLCVPCWISAVPSFLLLRVTMAPLLVRLRSQQRSRLVVGCRLFLRPGGYYSLVGEDMPA